MNAVPLSVTYKNVAWNFGVSTAYISLQAPDNVVVSDDQIISTTEEESAETESQSGWGDTTLTLRYLLLGEKMSVLFVDGVAKLKLPSGDQDKGLSSGAADLTLQVDLAYNSGHWLPMFTIGHKWPGTTDDYDPGHVWLASMGVQYRFNPELQAGVIFDYRQPYFSDSDPVE